MEATYSFGQIGLIDSKFGCNCWRNSIDLSFFSFYLVENWTSKLELCCELWVHNYLTYISASLVTWGRLCLIWSHTKFDYMLNERCRSFVRPVYSHFCWERWRQWWGWSFPIKCRNRWLWRWIGCSITSSTTDTWSGHPSSWPTMRTIIATLETGYVLCNALYLFWSFEQSYIVSDF